MPSDIHSGTDAVEGELGDEDVAVGSHDSLTRASSGGIRDAFLRNKYMYAHDQVASRRYI